MASKNQNNSTVNSQIGLIAGCVLLAAVIILAAYFYNKNSGYKTGSEEKVISEMTESLENANSENAEGTAEEPTPAPDFKVYNSDGTEITFSKKIGKPVIINFWATWCGPCKSEMPYFEEAYKKYGDKIEFMMINPTDGANDTNESVDKFLEEYGYSFPVYRDYDSDAVSVYGVTAFPTTFLVDKNGYFIGGYEGVMTEDMLNALIDLLLGNDIILK